MSFIKITAENLETFSLTLHPSRSFTSASDGNINGSVFLVPRPSRSLKDVAFATASAGWGETVFAKEVQLQKFNEKFLQDEKKRRANPSGIDSVNAAAGTGFSDTYPNTNYISFFDRLYRIPFPDNAVKYGGYLALVNETTQSAKNLVSRNIRAFQPPYQYCSLKNNAYNESLDGKDRSLKETIFNCLYPAYSDRPGQYSLSFTNYNALNFFTGSSVSTGAAFIYPGNTGSCVIDKRFTLSFFVNPRYTTENSLTSGRSHNDGSVVFKAGTIFHIASSIAVSLVTGSGRDQGGYPNTYRILLQLSHSADVSPDRISLTSSNGSRPAPENLVFLSDDFQITRNNWSHVSIKWSATFNNSTGSISVDGKKTYFNVKSSAAGGDASSLLLTTANTGEVFLGAFYTGLPGTTKDYFNASSGPTYGLHEYDGAGADPSNALSNDLNAEIHDVRYHSRYLSSDEENSERFGQFINDDSLQFWVPPTYLAISPTKAFYDRRALNVTSPQNKAKSTAPFNKYISGRVGGRIISVKNYSANIAAYSYEKLYSTTKLSRLESRSPVYPRLFNIEDYNAFNYAVGSSKTANDYIQRSAVVNRANHAIVPCDDGNFNPRFGYMVTASLWSNDRFGNPDPSIVRIDAIYDPETNLRNLYNKGDAKDPTYIDTFLNGISPLQGEFTNGLNYTSDSVVTPVLTNDLSSDEVTIFNISNLFYGDRIYPGSIVIRDLAVPGSGGRMTFTLRDDGLGNIYRADSGTKHATWNSVGNVFYDEGFIVIKSPNLYLFAQERFSIEFKGQRNMHVLTINVPCNQGEFNASSNPSYRDVPASLDFNEQDPSFVYITGINLHDDNLNIVMRANLAQPLKKRNSDEFLFRIKQDF